MDNKREGFSSENPVEEQNQEFAEISVADNLRQRIEAIADVHEVMQGESGEPPSFESVLDYDDWASMSHEERGVFVKWAEAKGYDEIVDWVENQDFEDESDSGSVEDEGGGTAGATPRSEFKEQLESVSDLAEVMGGKPDWREVMQDFFSADLTTEDRNEIVRWAQEKGFDIAWPKRGFVKYRLETDPETGSYMFKEDYEERGDEGYEAKTVGAAIVIPEEVSKRMEVDTASREVLIETVNEIRRDLNSGGDVHLALYKELPVPEWRYKIGGKGHKDEDEGVPEEILSLRDSDPEYFKRSEYKSWLGPRLQKKREEIISERLRKIEESTQRQLEVAREAVEAVLEQTVDVAGHLHEKEEAGFGLKTFVELLTMTALKVMREKADSSETIRDPEDIMDTESRNDMIRRTLSERYKDDPGKMKEIRELFGGEADKPVSAEGKAEGEVAPERIKSEEAVYGTYRRAIDQLEDEKKLKKFIEKKLERDRLNGTAVEKKVAERLLVEIEHGQAGPVSENWIEGLERSREEREFFDEHPLLDKRNVELLSDGKVIIHMDKLRPMEALHRAVSNIVRDSAGLGVPSELESGLDTGDAETVDKVVKYVGSLMLGRRKAEQKITKGYHTQIAEYVEATDELHIKNFDLLSKSTVAVYRQKLAEKG